MSYLSVFALFSFAYHVLAEGGGGPLITPCSPDDLPCLQKSCEDFIFKTYQGFGEPYNIEQYDPVELATLDMPGCCDEPDNPSKTVIHFKNIKITGLKDAKIIGFIMNQETKMISVNITIPFALNSDVVFEFTDKANSYSGTMEVKNAKVLTRNSYPFTMETDDKGNKHLEIGTVSTECEPLAEPEVILSTELQQALDNDPDIRATKEKFKTEMIERRKRFACKMAMLALPKLFDAWRKGTRVMSTSDLFTGQD